MASTILSDVIKAGRRISSFGVKDPEDERRRELAEALNKEALENWGDPQWHREQSAVLSESLDSAFENETLFNTYFDSRTVGEFDKLEFTLKKGVRAFWTHRAGYLDESQFEEEIFEMGRDQLGFHVSEFEGKIRANYAEYLSTLAALGRLRMETETNRRLFQLLTAASGSGTGSYVDATTTGLTKTVLDAAIDAVEDEPRLGSNVGDNVVTVIGRKSALGPLFGYDGFDQEAREEIRKTGRLGVYRGANIVVLKNIQDELGVPFVPNDQVYVMARDVGVFVKYGSVESWNWMENSVRYLHEAARMECGFLLHQSNLMRRIDLTGAPATPTDPGEGEGEGE